MIFIVYRRAFKSILNRIINLLLTESLMQLIVITPQ